MKTKLLTLLLAGAFTIGLAGCEQGGDQAGGGGQFDQSPPADQPAGQPGGAGDPAGPGGAGDTGGTGGAN